MNNVPEGAQLSDDGYYFWDGNDWQPVEGAGAAAGAASGAAATDTAGAAAQGEVTAEELAAVQSAEQIDERLKGHFEPDYDMYADDESAAETAAAI